MQKRNNKTVRLHRTGSLFAAAASLVFLGGYSPLVKAAVAKPTVPITSLVSIATDGTQAADGADSSTPQAVSADGRYVAFQPVATNLDSLGAHDANGDFDIFVKDRQTGKVSREDVTPQGNLSSGFGVQPALNADGRYIAFVGTDDLTSGSTNNLPDVYLRQRF